MSKDGGKIANFFSKLVLKSPLRTDAAPLPPRDDILQLQQQETNIPTSPDNATPTPSLITSIMLQDNENQNINSRIEEISTPETNNQLALNTPQPLQLSPFSNQGIPNIQSCQVYQFSNINNLHLGSVNTYSVTNKGENPSGSDDRSPRANQRRTSNSNSNNFKKTKTIEAMLKSTDLLEFRAMNIISTHLGEDWRTIGRQLGFSDGQIEQMFEDNYAKGVKEVIYQILLDWTRNDDNPTYGRIVNILWYSGQREVVYKLKEDYKDLKTANIVKNNQTTDKDII